MELLDLALRNVFRQRGRTLMVLSTIVFGVTALVLAGGFVKDTVVETGESLIRSQSGHLQVSLAGMREGGVAEVGDFSLRYLHRFPGAPHQRAQCPAPSQPNRCDRY